VTSNDERAPVSSEISDRVQTVADRLAKLGATVSDTARPAIDLEASNEIYLYMLNGVMAAGLSEDKFKETLAQVAALDPKDKSQDALLARASVQHHRDWLRHHNSRELLRHVWGAFFNDWDILICPQMATPAFEHDHTGYAERTIRVDNAVQPYFRQLFWAGTITVAYLPSTVFPTGRSHEGLPIGLQAVSAEYNDYICIDFARLVAEEMGGFVPPPGF